MLVTGDHGYASRSEAAMAVTLAMANRGWSFADFHAAMHDATNLLGRYYTHRSTRSGGCSRGPHDVQARLERDWDKAARLVADRPAVHDKVEVTQELGLLRDMAGRRDWKGRAGLRDRLVYTVLLDLATRHGTMTPAASVRTITEATPYHTWSTPARALASLQAAGLIRKDTQRPGKPGERWATCYRLTAAFELPTAGTGGGVRTATAGPHGDRVGAVVAVVDIPEEDRTRPSTSTHSMELGLVLTPAGAAVAAALSDQVSRPKEVAYRAGVSRSCAHSWLGRLALVGLAQWSPEGWTSGWKTPDQYARQEGSADILRRRRERLDQSQASWQRWCEDGRQKWLEQQQAALVKQRVRKQEWKAAQRRDQAVASAGQLAA